MPTVSHVTLLSRIIYACVSLAAAATFLLVTMAWAGGCSSAVSGGCSFWGAIIWGAGRFSGSGWRSENDPLEIARWRYASGEITQEQFEQFRRDLSSS